MSLGKKTVYQAARWGEPLIMDLSNPGARGIIPPGVEEEISSEIGDVWATLPESIRRTEAPNIPEVPQHRVLRHFLRLSQMCMGFDIATDMMGTCTMKYSPKVHDHISRGAKLADLHPLQAEESLQGLLELMFRFNRIMCEISGMDEFTFQPGSGAQGIYTNACLIRAYHESRGDLKRNEIITTAFSHPADAATPAVAGFKVITLMPGEMGFAEVDALKEAISDRTAGLMLTNPEDTGQYNPHIQEFVNLVHEAGGLCAYDQANGNPLLGVVRAADTGFDMCQFNLHKTFSAPHGALGMGCAAVGVKEFLRTYLPRPLVFKNAVGEYGLDYNQGEGIEKIRSFIGNVHAVLKAYSWVMSLGAEGLRAVAETAVLNNNYMLKKIREIPGVSIPWPENTHPKLEQVRYSFEKMAMDTGVGSHDIINRMVDYGVQHCMPSHVPMLVPEPFTVEPGESLTVEEMDQMVQVLRDISEEAYKDPKIVQDAPYNSSTLPIDSDVPEDPDCWAFTYRAYQRKKSKWSAEDRRKVERHSGGY